MISGGEVLEVDEEAWGAGGLAVEGGAGGLSGGVRGKMTFGLVAYEALRFCCA